MADRRLRARQRPKSAPRRQLYSQQGTCFSLRRRILCNSYLWLHSHRIYCQRSMNPNINLFATESLLVGLHKDHSDTEMPPRCTLVISTGKSNARCSKRISRDPCVIRRYGSNIVLLDSCGPASAASPMERRNHTCDHSFRFFMPLNLGHKYIVHACPSFGDHQRPFESHRRILSAPLRC